MFNRFLQHRSSNYNYSLHTQRVFTQNWLNSFWIAVTCSVLPFIRQDKQSDKYTWNIISLPSQNLYKCKQVVYVIVICVFCLRLFLQCCCCFFTCLSPYFILMMLLYFCLFVDNIKKYLATPLRVNKIVYKIFPKICHSKLILNCRSPLFMYKTNPHSISGVRS